MYMLYQVKHCFVSVYKHALVLGFRQVHEGGTFIDWITLFVYICCETLLFCIVLFVRNGDGIWNVSENKIRNPLNLSDKCLYEILENVNALQHDYSNITIHVKGHCLEDIWQWIALHVIELQY